MKRFRENPSRGVRDQSLLESDSPSTDVGGEDPTEPVVVAKAVQRAVHMDGVADTDAARRWIDACERRRGKPVERHAEPRRVDGPRFDGPHVARNPGARPVAEGKIGRIEHRHAMREVTDTVR